MNAMIAMLMAGFLMLPFTAQADDDECGEFLNKVEDEIYAAYFIPSSNPNRSDAGNSNQTNLLAKLEDARVKLSHDK